MQLTKCAFLHQYNMQIFVLIKKLFSIKLPIHFALWWVLQMVAICNLKLMFLKKQALTWKRLIFGRFFIRWYKDSVHCTIWRLYTEISSVLIYFWLKKELLSWVISMLVKFRNRETCRHKLERLIMLRLKFGKINLMIIHQIFGRLVLFCMRWLLCLLLLLLMIWRDCTKRCWKVSIQKFLLTSPLIFLAWWVPCYK